MLSSQGPGRYLSGRWERERARAMRDGTVAGEYSQDKLELEDEQIGGVNAKETFEADTTPVDPISNPKLRDIRKVNRRGPTQ